MQVKKIETDLAPKPQGFYSQAVQVDNLIFTSGQLPIVPDSGEFIKGDIEKQTIQVLENIKAILERAGSSLDNVIKATIFIRDISQWKTVNKVYARYLEKGIPPARSVIAGADIHYGVDIELEVIAYLK
ncbi:2-iminobutanoate/2-iminopropanoate deaminase [subsurface metagenome]